MRGWKLRTSSGVVGMLEVVEGSAIGDGGDQRAELEWGHRDAFAEGAHAAYAAAVGGKRLVRIDAKLLAGNVVAGELAESELVGVVADALKAEVAAEGLEIEIVRVSKRLGQIQVIASRRG